MTKRRSAQHLHSAGLKSVAADDKELSGCRRSSHAADRRPDV